MKTQVSFVRGEESDTGGGVAEILVTVDDSLLSSVFLPLHPLDRELSGPSLSCGCKAAGQSGCLSVTCVCVRVRQPWSPLSWSTGGGPLGITVVPVPAVR